MTLYKEKYRIESARKPHHHYASKNIYFITICTKKKLQWFGEIKNGEMQLSAIGEIVRQEWLKTFELRQGIATDAWCMMPDHLHGIIRIHAERRDAPLGRLNGKGLNEGRLLEQNFKTHKTDGTGKPMIISETPLLNGEILIDLETP